MNLRELEYFKAVSEQHSFTKAAEQLYVSQPCITAAVNRLEEFLGVQLLERNKKEKAVRVTAEGALFLARVDNILSEIDEAIMEVRNYNSSSIHFGLPPIIGAYLFPSMFAYIRKRYPHVQFKVTEYGSRVTTELLREGKLDLGIIGQENKEPIAGLHSVLLYEDHLTVCVPDDHPLAKRKSISIAELKEEHFIVLTNAYVHHEQLMKACTNYGFKPQIVFESDEIQTVKSMVASGAGISLIVSMAVQNMPGLVTVPLEEPMPFYIQLCWKEDHHLSKDCLSMIECMREMPLQGV
ncbi:LysR family transcriptional regulator [Paenibacillus alvei]|uniref:LysR family transcriptional regulator n=1 Tax=Paenibacillus alvei TaxID=44250 RepID=UPI0018CFA6E6|nr:LysR family transcriptional regulator [Paenibacillus alvei]MBG9732770.1 hypothetical protein [Paenibacillus alvei]MBG9744161.1 hypothetical protein [Paenibacillus alvei]MCY9580222.1 LysR family transcriptional regulator [Paenibacillus alvei]MCY9588149.1 LysR family transcriptional regulator [Paenibacillus alvei]